MRKISLTVMAMMVMVQPAMATSQSPIQQYLESEAGYAPATAPQPVPNVPYTVAQTPTTVPGTATTRSDGQPLGTGLTGMNY